MRLKTPSQEITLYLQSNRAIGSHNLQLNKLSLTGGASWIRNPTVAVVNANQGEIHSFAHEHTKELEQGHAFWLSTIRDINPENRTVVNEALTKKLNTLNSILESGINQGSMASIEAPLSELEESLKNTPNHVKIALLNKIQTQIDKEIPSNHQTHLIQQKALLETIIQDSSPTADSAQEQASQETINKAYSTLKNLFNRKKCINLLKNTLPGMLVYGTEIFTDLLGYCTLCLEKSNGKYADPQKIDTLIGLLVECALAYPDSASCTAGIRERCQRDGYFIKSSLDATPASTSNTVDLLTQIREHYAENKLMATSDEPSPLLGLLIMDTILKKHGTTTWSVCGEEENRRKLENLSPTSWQALQDHLGTEKAKLTAELAQLNETNSMNQEDKASQKETRLAKVNRLKQKQTVAHKLAVLETQLNTLHGIERNRSQDSDSSVEESLITLNNLIQKRTLLDLTVLAPETKQALQDECDALEEMIDKMTSAYEPEQADKNQNSAVFTQYHQAMIEDLSNTLSSYGLTYEHSRTVILTACLTQDFDKLSDSNIPAQYSYWALAYQQATGYLNTLAQQSIPTTSGLYKPNEDYQQNVQAKVVAEWLTPLHAMQNKLLRQKPEELVATLSNEEKILVLPATCQDQEQANAILAFMQNPVIMAHYINNDTTLLSGLAGNDLVLETLLQKKIAQENPDWSNIQEIFFQVIEECSASTTNKLITLLDEKKPEILVATFTAGTSLTALELAITKGQTKTALNLIDYLNKKHFTVLVQRDFDYDSPLNWAIRHGRIETANTLIDLLNKQHPETLECGNHDGVTPLHDAITSGATDIAIKLINILKEKSPHSLVERNVYDEDPLCLAIEKGQEKVAYQLIDNILTRYPETLIEKHYDDGLCPLHAAIGFKQKEIAKKLIDSIRTTSPEALAASEEKHHNTPLHVALNLGLTDIANELIDCLSETNPQALTVTNKYGLTPLDIAIANKTDNANRLIKILLDIAIANKTDNANRLIKILVEKYPKTLTTKPATPLSWLIRTKQTELAIQLISLLSIENPKALTAEGQANDPPLHYAIILGRTEIASEIIDILSDKYPDALVEEKNGDTPLHYAVQSGQTDITSKLINRLSENYPEVLGKETSHGESPLFQAIALDSTDIAIKLINSMMEVNPRALIAKNKYVNTSLENHFGLYNHYDKTPLHDVIAYGRTDIACELIDRLSEKYPDALVEKEENGETPLHLAIQSGQTDIASKLINSLSKVNPHALEEKNNNDETPLQVAKNKGEEKIIQALQNTLGMKTIEDNHTQTIHKESTCQDLKEQLEQFGEHPEQENKKISDEVKPKHTNHEDTMKKK